MKNLFTLLALLSFFAAHATTDTVYFNAEWKKIAGRQGAKFFRVQERMPNNLYKVNDYYASGVKQMSGYYSNIDSGTKEGRFIYYDELGNKTSEGLFVHSVEDGEWKFYREDKSGILWYTNTYVKGILQGLSKSYYKSGKLKREQIFNNGERTSGKKYAEDGKELPFTPFMIMPEYQGNLAQYLSDSIVYPKECINKDISGRVRVKFVVNKKGKIEDVKIVLSVHPLLDAEAIRVVSAMPDWRPGTMDDEPAKIFFTLPIKFSLQ